MENQKRQITKLQNKKTLVALILIIVTMASLALMSGTFAKYATTITGTGSGTGASWGVSFLDGDPSQTFNYTLTDTANASNTIAPGSKGSFKVYIDGSTTDVDFLYSIDIVKDNTLMSKVIEFYYDDTYSVPATHGSYDGIMTKNTKKTLAVYWQWVTTSDAEDTAIGALPEADRKMTFQINATATQLVAGTAKKVTTIAEINALNDGDTAYLTADITESSDITINKAVNINLDGHTITANSITFSSTYASAVAIKHGKLAVTGAGDAGKIVIAMPNATVNLAVIIDGTLIEASTASHSFYLNSQFFASGILTSGTVSLKGGKLVVDKSTVEPVNINVVGGSNAPIEIVVEPNAKVGKIDVTSIVATTVNIFNRGKVEAIANNNSGNTVNCTSSEEIDNIEGTVTEATILTVAKVAELGGLPAIIANAKDGDTITLDEGTFNLPKDANDNLIPISITKNLTLRGISKEKTTILSQRSIAKDVRQGLIYLAADNISVTISDITLDGGNESDRIVAITTGFNDINLKISATKIVAHHRRASCLNMDAGVYNTKVLIEDSELYSTHYNLRTYYLGLDNNITVNNSTIMGWSAIYDTGSVSSNLIYNINDSKLIGKSARTGPQDAFAAIVLEGSIGAKITLTNSALESYAWEGLPEVWLNVLNYNWNGESMPLPHMPKDNIVTIDNTNTVSAYTFSNKEAAGCAIPLSAMRNVTKIKAAIGYGDARETTPTNNKTILFGTEYKDSYDANDTDYTEKEIIYNLITESGKPDRPWKDLEKTYYRQLKGEITYYLDKDSNTVTRKRVLFKIVQAPEFFVVKFLDGKDLIFSQNVELGKNAIAPANPTKEGYTFVGWDKSFDYVMSDLTVNAVFQKNPSKVTINKKVGTTVTEFETQTVKPDELAKRPSVLVGNQGLYGFYTDEACTIPFDFEKDKITADCTIYANVVNNVISYRQYKSENGSENAYYVGDEFIGFYYAGWNNNTACIEVNLLREYQGKNDTVAQRVYGVGRNLFVKSAIQFINIPDTYTRIDASAFSECNSLKKVFIPKNISVIEQWAFMKCSSIESIIVLDEGNTTFRSVDNCLISIADKTLIAGCSTSIIPTDGSVTSIRSTAFQGSSITNLVIPEGVLSIGDSAFRGCELLESIKIANTVTTISSSAFSGCSILKEIVIPTSVVTMGSSIFQACNAKLKIFCEATEKPNGWFSNWLQDSTTGSTAYFAADWEYINGVPTPKAAI